MLKLNPKVTKNELLSRGASPRAIGLFRMYDPVKSCSQFLITRYDDDGSEVKTPVSTKLQVSWLNQVYEEPMREPLAMFLADYKGGDIVRNVALAIFSQALYQFELTAHRSRPLWIRLHQGYDTQLPLHGEDRPAFVVIDNVFADSTPVKVEKLRDLLAFYEDTPILILTSSPGNPLALVEKFTLRCDFAVLLRDTRTLKSEEEI